MDWARAKTYLIVVFLAVDVLLALGYRSGARGAGLASPSPQARTSLAREGIVLLTEVPRVYPRRLPWLAVRPATVDGGRLARRVLGDEAAVPRVSSGEGQIFERGRERLTVLARGTVLYEDRSLAEASVGPPLDAGGARRMAQEFLARRGWELEDASPDLVLPVAGGGGYQVYLVRSFHAWPLFPSYAVFLVTAGGVRAVQEEWLSPDGWTGERVEILAPSEALRRVRAYLRARSREEGGKVERLLVEGIELGFAGARGEGPGPWVLAPSWRVVTRGGAAFYVYNPDGRVEPAS